MDIIVVGHHAKSMINFRGLLISRFVNAGHHVTVLVPENNPEFREKLEELGVELINFPLNRTGLNPFQDLLTFYFILKIFLKKRPDMVFSIAIKPIIYSSLAARLVGVRKVFSLISGIGYAFTVNSLKEYFVNRIVVGLYRISLKNNDVVFFQNPDDRKDFLRFKLISPSQGVVVNGSGVDLNFYYMAENNNKLKEKITFLLGARIIKDKGILVYVEAARILKNKFPQAEFHLIGPFDDHPSRIPEEEVKGWVEDGIINYFGSVNDVRPYILKSSVFVLPALHREGTPRSILEAMSMGRPIITTDAPGCREVVVNDQNGFLIPSKNVNALVEAMERFIKMPGLIKKMGQASRQIAVEKYDVNKVNEKIIKSMGLSIYEAGNFS